LRVAEDIQLENSELTVERHDSLIKLSYAIFSIAFAAIIYAASLSSGAAFGEFASMSVFP
jgi:hypothetical protein